MATSSAPTSGCDLRPIEQVLYRYCAAVDRKDWALLESCYHPDATDDHGDFDGPIGGFIEWIRQRHEKVVQSFHAVSNIRLVDETDGAVLIESLCNVRQTLLDREDHPRRIAVGCRYVDVFTAVDGRWLIHRRTTTYDWVEEVTSRDLFDRSPRLLRSERGTTSLDHGRRTLHERGS